MYLLHISTKEQFDLEDGWEHHEGEKFTKIFPSEEGNCRIITTRKIRINGRFLEGQKLLHHNDFIQLAPGHLYIFKNNKEQVEYEKSKKLRLKTSTQLRKTEDIEELKKEAKQKFCDFINFHSPKNFQSFILYFVSFLKKVFNLERIILYKPSGTKWLPLLARTDKEKEYIPPMKILREVYLNSRAAFFRIEELGEEDLSKSLIENKIQTGFCIPLYQENSPFLVVYSDNSEKELKTKDFLIVQYIITYAEKHLAKFLEIAPPLKEINLEEV